MNYTWDEDKKNLKGNILKLLSDCEFSTTLKLIKMLIANNYDAFDLLSSILKISVVQTMLLFINDYMKEQRKGKSQEEIRELSLQDTNEKEIKKFCSVHRVKRYIKEFGADKLSDLSSTLPTMDSVRYKNLLDGLQNANV